MHGNNKVILAQEEKPPVSAVTHPPITVSVDAAGKPQVTGPLADKKYCMKLLLAALAIVVDFEPVDKIVQAKVLPPL